MGLLLGNTSQVDISLDFLKGNVLCPLLLLSPFGLFISEFPGLGKPSLLRWELPLFLWPSRRFLLQPGLCFLCRCMSGPSGIPHSFTRSLPGFQTKSCLSGWLQTSSAPCRAEAVCWGPLGSASSAFPFISLSHCFSSDYKTKPGCCSDLSHA